MRSRPGPGSKEPGSQPAHSAARHWLTSARIPRNVVSQWLGHATSEVALRINLVIVGSIHSIADVP